jgi:hypothetical protein
MGNRLTPLAMSLGVCLAGSLAGCAPIAAPPPARYLATSDPLLVSLTTPGLCIAVDPSDPHGVWWWQPGPSGCGTRSTGPEIFHAEQATVSRSTESNVIAVAFRLQLISAHQPSFRDVRLVIEEGRMRTLDGKAAVAVHRRSDLIVPSAWPAPK